MCGGHAQDRVGRDQSTHQVDPGRLRHAPVSRGVGGRINRARARCTEHARPHDAATRGRNCRVQDLVAVAGRADPRLRTANALRARSRSRRRQDLADTEKRVLDADPEGIAVRLCARRIENGEVDGLGCRPVLQLRAQRRGSARLHGHEENGVAWDCSNCVADVQSKFAEKVGSCDGQTGDAGLGIHSAVPYTSLTSQRQRHEADAVPSERGDRDRRAPVIGVEGDDEVTRRATRQLRAGGAGWTRRGVRLVELVIDVGITAVRQAGPVGIQELLLNAVDWKKAERDFTGDRRRAIYRDFVDEVVLRRSIPRRADPRVLVVFLGA